MDLMISFSSTESTMTDRREWDHLSCPQSDTSNQTGKKRTRNQILIVAPGLFPGWSSKPWNVEVRYRFSLGKPEWCASLVGWLVIGRGCSRQRVVAVWKTLDEERRGKAETSSNQQRRARYLSLPSIPIQPVYIWRWRKLFSFTVCINSFTLSLLSESESDEMWWEDMTGLDVAISTKLRSHPIKLKAFFDAAHSQDLQHIRRYTGHWHINSIARHSCAQSSACLDHLPISRSQLWTLLPYSCDWHALCIGNCRHSYIYIYLGRCTHYKCPVYACNCEFCLTTLLTCKSVPVSIEKPRV